MKKTYVKPTMKLVEWNFQRPICDSVYVNSACIHVINSDGNGTRIDHNETWTNIPGGWNDWRPTEN